MRILVTGCSGLVGTFLIRKLLSDKINQLIVGVDIKSFPIEMNDKMKKRFVFIST